MNRLFPIYFCGYVLLSASVANTNAQKMSGEEEIRVVFEPRELTERAAVEP